MVGRYWKVQYSGKIENIHQFTFQWHEKPSDETVAHEVLIHLQQKPEGVPIIDISRTDPEPRLTKITFLGYKIVSVIEVDSPNQNAKT